MAGESLVLGEPHRKPGQRTVRLGKLQAAEAGRVERHGGIGRRRMPGQGQHRAVGQILFDLGGESAVELAQHDADARIGVARPERRLQVELIVGRQRQDRHCFGDARRLQPVAAVRPPGHEHRADGGDRPGKFRILGPQHDDAMPRHEAELARRAERERIAADNDHHGTLRRHRSAVSRCWGRSADSREGCRRCPRLHSGPARRPAAPRSA